MKEIKTFSSFYKDLDPILDLLNIIGFYTGDDITKFKSSDSYAIEYSLQLDSHHYGFSMYFSIEKDIKISYMLYVGENYQLSREVLILSTNASEVVEKLKQEFRDIIRDKQLSKLEI